MYLLLRTTYHLQLVHVRKSQVNVRKISIKSNLPFNDDANNDKQTNTLQKAQIKHSQNVHQKQI